MVIQTLQLVIS